MKKLKGLKKAVGEFNRYNDRFRWFSYLMYDDSDGSIWCDTFTDCNSYAVYHSDTIHKIGYDVLEEYGKVSMQTVKEYIEKHF